MAVMVMVLNDGETYTTLDGCKIVSIPSAVDVEDYDEYIKNFWHYETPLVRFQDHEDIRLETSVPIRVNGQLMMAGN